jgi:16S rRNA (guanine527-N7)-methyltransferase
MELILKYFADFSDQQIKQFSLLQEVYEEWNQNINVISRKDIHLLYERHVLHSLSIPAAFPMEDGLELVDIGTGGGFPGIPLAIYYPNIQFHLVDSIAKKLKVVEAVVDALGLTNITFEHNRIENVRNRKFDFAISRAVAPLKDLCQWARPLLHANHRMHELKNGLICLKGGDLAEEISVSGVKPFVQEVYQLFPEEYFKEKFVFYVPLKA